ncbi:toxin PIN [Adlercreutzia equolifaciens subsp. celatus]|uniref:Toxin PIN n=1 Tax=Adlercreutzia equolifaciens subsp. celatus TaxID=394340 RepID=A0A369P491_9ACTN|nr:toxin PIN [Adlercreutzia equolifaciens subsp. celatus]
MERWWPFNGRYRRDGSRGTRQAFGSRLACAGSVQLAGGISAGGDAVIVLDVNAAIAIAKGTEEGRTLRELMIEGEEVIAPHFFLTELGNVVWQIVRAGELDEEDFPGLFERAAGFVDRFVPAEGILLEAIHAAIQNNHPVYDMLYFIVTRRNAATLFTFDKKLRAVCEANGVNCLGTASL